MDAKQLHEALGRGLGDSTRTSSQGPADRYFVTVVSVGAAGLTQRPAVVERHRMPAGEPRTIKVFRKNEEHLANALAAKMNADAVAAAELEQQAGDGAPLGDYIQRGYEDDGPPIRPDNSVPSPADKLERLTQLIEAEHSNLVQAAYTRFASDIKLATTRKDRELEHLAKVRETRLAALPAQIEQHPEWF
jgi:hypothetical protein